MTTNLLDTDGCIVGRLRELAELRAGVEEAGRSGGSCVFLSGVPGVGKSTLIQAFGEEVSGRDCIFAYGRCREGTPAPYAAVSDALAAVVRGMETTGAAERDRWRDDLNRGMSGLADALGELVPDLTPVLGRTDHVADLGSADARRRLHRAAIRLVSETASYRPIVLAIDDLHWADRGSLLLIAELLSVSVRNVVVIGAFRTGEFDPGAAGLAVESPHRIDLAPLSREEVQSLLTAVCGPGAELGEVAAEFHHRTGGNPLRVRQLFYRAQREGALSAGAGSRRFWDLHVLSAFEVNASAGESLGRYLDQLRPSDRVILGSLACIHGEFDLDDAATAAGQPPEAVARALWSGLELRLLEAVDIDGRRIANAISREARYRFSHDRVAESAREGLSEKTVQDVHLRLGRRLMEQPDERLFEAARYLAAGGQQLPADDRERIVFAEVLRKAAQRARGQTSFPLVLEFCQGGLSLLGAQRWLAYYSLARELTLQAADAALLDGDVSALQILLDEAETMVREPSDRAHIDYLRLKGLVAANRLREALEAGLAALDRLGEPLPPEAGKPRMANALVRMKLATRRWSTEQLLRLPPCENRRAVEAQRILAELRSLSYIVRPNLNPLIVRKQLDLTLAHGHTPSSPLVLVSYGLLLVMTGDREGSQRFGEAGLLLAEREEFVAARPQTVFLYLNFIRHWQHPLNDGLGHVRNAVDEALDQGDQEYAGFLAAVMLSQSFWVGRPLNEIDMLARTLIPQIRSQPVPRALCQAVQQLCLNMMGRSEDPYLLAGESGYDEREAVPLAHRDGDEVALSTAATMKLGLHFWCGDYAGAVAVADEAIEHAGGMAGTAIFQLIHMKAALSRIHAAPAERATAVAVRKALRLHRAWAADAPANYAAPCALIEGVWARARGQQRSAERYLDQAISLAEQHRLPLIAALAYEESGILYSLTSRAVLREHMLRAAHQRWLSQGMVVRAGKLARAHPWLLSRELVKINPDGVDPAGAQHLTRALSGARSPERLANVMLAAVADITGAHRSILLTGEEDDLAVLAVRDGPDTAPVDEPWAVPYDREIVDRVIDGGTPVTEPARDTPATPARIGVPIRVQDKTIGVVYAERCEPRSSFSQRDEQAVAFLCEQAAAPLWTFHLETKLRAADEQRRSLMDMQSRFLPTELLRILDIDDLRRVRSGHQVRRELTVLISDIRGYTTLVEDMDVEEASNLATAFLRAVEVPIIACGGMIQDVRGDEIVALFEGDPDCAVRAGLAMLASLREHNRERVALGSKELRVGIGINTGVVGVGLMGGVNRMVLAIIGDTVNLAARIESLNKRYGSALLISDATRAQLRHAEQFDIRRMERVMVVNRRRPVTIYEVCDGDSQRLRLAKRSAQEAFDEAFTLFDRGDVERARIAFERCRQLLPDDPVAALHLAHCDAVTRGDMAPGQEVVLRQK